MKARKSFAHVAAVALLLGSASIGTAQVSKDPPVPPTRRSDPPAEPGQKASIDASDRQIMETMARAGVAEVEAGQVAEQNAGTPEVKKFAQQMVQDHGKANRELEGLAAKKGVTLPKEPDAEHQKALAEAKRQKGSEFDQTYVAQAGLKDHAAAKQLFEKAAKEAKDPDLRSFAQKTLPVIDHHYAMAQQLHKQVQGSASGASGAEPRAEAKPASGA
jgi:putative membrane protein